MNTAKLISVVECTLTTRGDGQSTPYRIITQYFSTDGKLLAENDPCEPLKPDVVSMLTKIRDIVLRHPGNGEINGIPEIITEFLENQ